jgi:hypothetical protein
MSDVPDDAHNPEVSMPVHPDNDWHLPELVGRVWRASEIQDALETLGFDCTDTDPNVLDGDGDPIRLTRNRRWVRGELAIRVPLDGTRIVSPYLAACVVAVMADG